MMLPCQYCKRAMVADDFASWGVPPCCRRCQWIPLVIGGVILFVTAGVAAWVLW